MSCKGVGVTNGVELVTEFDALTGVGAITGEELVTGYDVVTGEGVHLM